MYTLCDFKINLGEQPINFTRISNKTKQVILTPVWCAEHNFVPICLFAKPINFAPQKKV